MIERALEGALTMVNFYDPRLPLKFWAKCIPVTFAGCWLWFGPITNGYGRFKVEGPRVAKRRVRAHRHAYIKLIGPVAPGLELDHRCRTKCCVNPSHLEPVTHVKNMQRSRVGWNLRDRTHCNHGHAFTQENTVFHKRIGRKETRACRTCLRERSKRSKMKRRTERLNASERASRTCCKHGHALTSENTYLRRYRGRTGWKETRACRTCLREADKRHKTKRAALG